MYKQQNILKVSNVKVIFRISSMNGCMDKQTSYLNSNFD